jgi:hypothetical protein
LIRPIHGPPRLNYLHLLHYPHSPTIPRPLYPHLTLAIHRGPRLPPRIGFRIFLRYLGRALRNPWRHAKSQTSLPNLPYMSYTTPAYRLPGPNWSDPDYPDAPQALEGKLARMPPSLGCVNPSTAVVRSGDGSPRWKKMRNIHHAQVFHSC